MKKHYGLLVIGAVISMTFLAFKPDKPSKPETDRYIVIAWNEPGMHYANQVLCHFEWVI